MNYCTLFNIQYLSRGLALYYSLLKTTENFHLYIFAFDSETYQILKKLELHNVTVISLQEFETSELLKVKKERTIGEYCWTCTSATILYCLEKYNLPEICYLDADLYFWRSPSELLLEARDASILITEHRYTKEYDRANISGKYCVQFMYFKNDANGIKALMWWRDACLDWCYNRVEPGRFGDQKYLDDWLTRFEGVKVLQHLGGGVAPWNIQQYDLIDTTQAPILIERTTAKKFPLVFYHFHGLKFINNQIECGGYKIAKNIIMCLYQRYVTELMNQEKWLKQDDVLAIYLQNLNIHGVQKEQKKLVDHLKHIKQRLSGVKSRFNRVELTNG